MNEKRIKAQSIFATLFLLLLGTSFAHGQLPTPTPPVNIILDSDMADNVDDVGDHALLWSLANSGQVKVLALVLSSTNNYSAPTARVLANYFGHPNVLIGAYQGNIPNATGATSSLYTQQVAARFGVPGDTRANYPDAVAVYRQALAAAPNGSVYIVSGGFCEPLMGLLQSGADSISPLTGPQLVAQKVAYLISAAGTFPSSGSNPSSNFLFDPNGASYVFANWPGPIVSVGTEVGGDVITGPAASADPTKNPVKYAYNLFCNNGANCANSVPAWTQVAILYAVTGLGSNFFVGGLNGSSVVENSSGPLPGTNTWSQTPNNQQSYIEKSISAAQMETILSPYVQTAGSFTPVANSQTVETTGGPVTITLTAADGNGDTLTYSVLTQPSHGTLTGTAPNLIYAPNANFTGTDGFTFQVFDGSIGSNVATVTIQVGAAGAITKIGQAENSCTGGGCTSLSVLYSPATGSSALVFVWFDFTNPVSTVSVKDSEGNNLTLDQSYSGFCSGGSSCMQVWREAQVPSGVTGYSLSWTGGDNARAIVVEYSGLGAYDPGVFHGNDNGYNGGTAWTSGISGALSNPSDLLFCFAVDGRDATQTWIQSGSFTTILDTNDTSTGAAHLAQWINPGTTAGEVCSGTISVTGGQEVVAIVGGYQPAAASGQPVANSQSVTSNGSPLTITLTASDSDGDALTYTIANNPSHGTLSGTPPNVTYTPATNFSGVDSFTFYANDGHTNSNIATATITVTPVVVQATSQTVTSNGAPVAITLTATDSDGNPLTYSIVSNPAHGSLSGTAPHVTYTPTSGFVGTDNFTFQAHDGQFNSNIATITINVGAVSGVITKIGQAQNFCQGGSCTSLSIPYSPTAGNSVLIFLWFDFVNPTTNVSAKDSLGNSLSLDQTYAGSFCAGGFSCVQVWRQTTAPSGVTDYALNWTGGDNAGAIVVEYSGLGSYDPAVFAGHDNGYNSGPSWTTSTGGTLSNSSDLLFCFAVDGRDASQTWTQSGSFTAVLNANDASTGALHVAQLANPGATAGQSCSGTVGSTGNQQIVAIVGGYQPAK